MSSSCTQSSRVPPSPKNQEREMTEEKRKGKVVVVGGSIAGISCAHAMLAAGWDVVVLEKTCSPPTGSATGAGLGLDPLAQKIIQSWLQQPQLLQMTTLPLTIDQNQATDGNKKISWMLTRDENFNFRAAYWADLHSLLYKALPPEIVLWGNLFVSFSISDDKSFVKVRTKVLQTGDTIDIVGDLLIAADGCLSSIRQSFLPDLKLRYSGYCAWRGVLDFSDNENSETIIGLKKTYPDLGRCLYFDLGSEGHSVFYELLNKRINWIWETQVTMKVSSDVVEKMHEAAERSLGPRIGEAHPTTPHGLRSTNMSILDAAVLGKCLKKWGVESLNSALQEYQSIRLSVVSEQVLHSRRLGRTKQGLILTDCKPFDPRTASEGDCQELMQRNMPFFSHIPPILN
ncbi:FAD/NAD(P)-binding oxidoreductase family protein [Abeliophyllum distichum]|uniref:FAD/NAD(P)-binding oxidoreductase family protein n=1 Tax=Abeliophyllum distichum TaxID=126358 RepID=A0ABD1UKI2_9LAMI